jgi:hypothetical protein
VDPPRRSGYCLVDSWSTRESILCHAAIPRGCVINVKLVARVALSFLAPLALLAAGSPAQASEPAEAVPVCLPEAPVCAGLDNGDFLFTVKPPPVTLSVSVTVNGEPGTGSLTVFTEPGFLQGSYQPSTPLVSGDVFCMSFYADGVPPGPYCDTAP